MTVFLAFTTIEVVMENKPQKMASLLHSRRFWLTLASLGIVTAAEFGLDLDPESVNAIVIAFGLWIMGDSFRATE